LFSNSSAIPFAHDPNAGPNNAAFAGIAVGMISAATSNIVQSPVININKEISQRAFEKAAAGDELFDKYDLDCISGIETGLTWFPGIANKKGTRWGLFQFNKANWDYAGIEVDWNNGLAATDADLSSAAAIKLLHKKILEIKELSGDNNFKASEHIIEAIDRFGEHDGHYGQAVSDCAKKLRQGNLQGYQAISDYLNWK
jgi:hypothetical protein